MAKILFKEEQYFTKTVQFYIVVFIVVTAVLVFGAELIQQTWDSKLNHFAHQPNPNFLKVIIIGSLFLVYVIVTSIKLKLSVQIAKKGVVYIFAPLVKSTLVKPEEIDFIKFRKGKYVRRYGRSVFSKIFGAQRKAYVVKGNMAVQIYLKNGTSVLLGTQCPEMFISALEKISLKKNG